MTLVGSVNSDSMGNLQIGRNERPELTERELTYITLHTNFTRKQIDDFYIRFLSFYPRGCVNFDEFSQLYSSELEHIDKSRLLLERLFKHIDTDKNGELNFKEILFFKGLTQPETNIDEKFRWIFLFYDTNQDNRISRNEFLDLCSFAYSIHGQTLTISRLKQLTNLFEKFDFNHDEQLNCDEFICLCQSTKDLFEFIAPIFKNTNWNSTTNHSFQSDRIDYLIKRTKFTREQILSYYEQFSKHCPTKTLTKADFINFYRKILPSKQSDTYCEFLFQAFDCLSSDGVIQFDEYLLAIYIHSNLSTINEKFEWLFNAYDRDRNGFINYDELTQILHAIFILNNIDREQFSVGYVAYEIMTQLDLNNDDQISKQEFIHMTRDKELTKFLAPIFVKQEI